MEWNFAANIALVALAAAAAVRLRRRPAPPLAADDLAFLRRRLPWIDRLPAARRATWEEQVRVFLARVQFEGCRGQAADRPAQLLVAAQACLLVAGRPGRPFRKLHSVLLYPAGFRVRTSTDLGPHAWLEGEEDRIGESWLRGTVVLSWADVDPDLRAPDLACNLVYHEFAHQLDAENGDSDGVPDLPAELRDRWRTVMGEAYRRLVKADKRGEDTFLDPYGAENPAEFFAVITEAFFDEGPALKAEDPALYGLLADFYGVEGAALS